jgi:hypothetical protein
MRRFWSRSGYGIDRNILESGVVAKGRERTYHRRSCTSFNVYYTLNQMRGAIFRTGHNGGWRWWLRRGIDPEAAPRRLYTHRYRTLRENSAAHFDSLLVYHPCTYRKPTYQRSKVLQLSLHVIAVQLSQENFTSFSTVDRIMFSRKCIAYFVKVCLHRFATDSANLSVYNQYFSVLDSLSNKSKTAAV